MIESVAQGATVSFKKRKTSNSNNISQQAAPSAASSVPAMKLEDAEVKEIVGEKAKGPDALSSSNNQVAAGSSSTQQQASPSQGGGLPAPTVGKVSMKLG